MFAVSKANIVPHSSVSYQQRQMAKSDSLGNNRLISDSPLFSDQGKTTDAQVKEVDIVQQTRGSVNGKTGGDSR
uniref:Lipoprotein n=1 Tax=Heterorhabditis bacteriophora TaxID=37862 RepID=A0A1I7XRT2_HETBA